MRDVGLEILGQCLARILPFGELEPPALEMQRTSFKASESVQIEVPALNISGRGISIILGPNGAGKSLLIRLLHGLVEADEGRISFDGQSVVGKGRNKQAMVFQKPILLRRSVAANLRYALKFAKTPKAEREDRLKALIELAGLEGKEKQSARSLSGGEEQCLALACALARQPKMLFLDEPTSSLDPNATLRIEMILHQAAIMGVRIVMVSHDLAQAERLADEVIFVHQGRITEQQLSANFFDNPKSVQAHAFLSGRLVL